MDPRPGDTLKRRTKCKRRVEHREVRVRFRPYSETYLASIGRRTGRTQWRCLPCGAVGLLTSNGIHKPRDAFLICRRYSRTLGPRVVGSAAQSYGNRTSRSRPSRPTCIHAPCFVRTLHSRALDCPRALDGLRFCARVVREPKEGGRGRVQPARSESRHSKWIIRVLLLFLLLLLLLLLS